MKEPTIEFSADVFEQALIFSIKAHHGQQRKGDGRPYIMHPITVMTTMYDIKKSHNALLLGTAAVLHDVVEDCKVPLRDITRKFGPVVASIVSELTSDPEQIEKIGKMGYLCLKMEKMSSYALALKLCDRYDNVKDLGSLPKKDRDAYIKETVGILKYITAMRELTHTHLVLIELIYERLIPWTSARLGLETPFGLKTGKRRK
jgi:(p)ppGpp synthase/HD superfamily hydrolase